MSVVDPALAQHSQLRRAASGCIELAPMRSDALAAGAGGAAAVADPPQPAAERCSAVRGSSERHWPFASTLILCALVLARARKRK
ncbi:MAG TPA: hypothetical protein VFN67_11460 [Polyangiales bacterium]|nr:hypothetical protein [Polyangiales bacterium]